MLKKSKTTQTEKAWTKPLDTPVSFTFNWVEYENDAEVDAAQAWMSKAQQRKAINARAANKARQAAQNQALLDAGHVKPNLENDDQLRLREFYKVLMSSKKYTEEAARALASSTLGVEWEDSEDDE